MQTRKITLLMQFSLISINITNIKSFESGPAGLSSSSVCDADGYQPKQPSAQLTHNWGLQPPIISIPRYVPNVVEGREKRSTHTASF